MRQREDGLVGLPPSPLFWAEGGGTLSPFSSFSLLVINVCYRRPNQAEKRTPKRCCQDTPRPRDEEEEERAADKRTHTFGQVFERVRWFLPPPPSSLPRAGDGASSPRSNTSEGNACALVLWRVCEKGSLPRREREKGGGF